MPEVRLPFDAPLLKAFQEKEESEAVLVTVQAVCDKKMERALIEQDLASKAFWFLVHQKVDIINKYAEIRKIGPDMFELVVSDRE